MRIISRSSVEQITLAEARLHCKLDAIGSPPSHPDDDELELLIAGVRRFTERYLGRSLVPTVVEAELDEFPSDGVIVLQGGPIASIDEVGYTDENGQAQLVDPADYMLNVDQVLGRVILTTGSAWPAVSAGLGAVRVRYTLGNNLAGESPDPDPIEADVKVAMLITLAYLYKNRGDEAVQQQLSTGQVPLPLAAVAFLSPHILRRRFA